MNSSIIMSAILAFIVGFWGVSTRPEKYSPIAIIITFGVAIALLLYGIFAA